MKDSVFWVPWNEVKSRRAGRLNYLVSRLCRWKIWVFLSLGSPAVMCHRAAFIGLNGLNAASRSSMRISWQLLSYNLFLKCVRRADSSLIPSLSNNHTVAFNLSQTFWVSNDFWDSKNTFSYKLLHRGIVSVYTWSTAALDCSRETEATKSLARTLWNKRLQERRQAGRLTVGPVI